MNELSVNVTQQRNFHKENLFTHWRQKIKKEKEKKISEKTHIGNNMFRLWLSRLQLQPNSKARMDLHCQCKHLEIVETDQV